MCANVCVLMCWENRMMNVLWFQQQRSIITVKVTDLHKLIILTFIYLGEVCLHTLTWWRCQLEAAIPASHWAVSWFTEAFDAVLIGTLAHFTPDIICLDFCLWKKALVFSHSHMPAFLNMSGYVNVLNEWYFAWLGFYMCLFIFIFKRAHLYFTLC